MFPRWKKPTVILGSILLLLFLAQWMGTAFAGGTNSIFARMDHMVNQLEKKHKLSEEEIQDWRDTIQRLRDKVDARIKINGGGMNRNQDRDLFDAIDTQGRRLFEYYQKNKD
jgi:hypothetical protein